MILHLSLWKDYSAIIFLIHLVFLVNNSRFHSRINFGDCDVCYLFHRENLACPYKSSKVEVICSACIKRKYFVPERNTTWIHTCSSIAAHHLRSPFTICIVQSVLQITAQSFV